MVQIIDSEMCAVDLNSKARVLIIIPHGHDVVVTGFVGESGALRSGVWFRANNLMIMMTQHNFCLLFD